MPGVSLSASEDDRNSFFDAHTFAHLHLSPPLPLTAIELIICGLCATYSWCRERGSLHLGDRVNKGLELDNQAGFGAHSAIPAQLLHTGSVLSSGVR
jgi:hypothetical protein